MLFWLLLISIFLVLLIIIFISVPWAERKALFFPSRKCHWKPHIPYEDVDIPIPGECGEWVNGWYFNNFPGRDIVNYCHGNSGSITNRSYIINLCHKLKLNLFVFDYRGFGQSSGKPSKRNLRKDGEAVYKYLTKERGVKPQKLIIWGESLGGIAATWTASKYPCKALILLCTFSGLDDAITYYFEPGVKQSLAYGYANMAAMRYDIMPNRKYIRQVKCPTIILHSQTDEIIPYECAKILHKNIKHDKKLLITIKGGHSSPVIKKEQLKELFDFCRIPYYDYPGIEKLLKDLETFAKRHNNFIDKL